MSLFCKLVRPRAAPAVRLLSFAQFSSINKIQPSTLDRLASISLIRSYVSSPFAPNPSPSPNIPDLGPDESPKRDSPKSNDGSKKGGFFPSFTSSPMLDAALTTCVGLFLVFGSGMAYLEWYKFIVLYRMEKAFAPGYDPALELSQDTSSLRSKRRKRRQLEKAGLDPDSVDSDDKEKRPDHIVRFEQALVDRIVSGKESGKYYLISGPKGTGKSTMILDSMRAIKADGAAFVEAHPDLEVFRLRFGKALNYDFFEDWQGGLFSRADPRNGGPSLDIERALNKLEKVALRYTKKQGRPLCLVFNDIHLFPNDDEGHRLLHQLQQRAEAWSDAGICTMVFTTDDFWPYEMLRKNASRMRILSVYDLPHATALRALRDLRLDTFPQQDPPKESVLRECVKLVGGRTSYLTRIARAKDMMEEAQFMVRSEREFLMSQIGLIPDVDDDKMEEMKWSSSSWLLLRALAQAKETLTSSSHSNEVIEQPATEDNPSLLGYVTFGRARQVMTRGDYLNRLDHLNIISIDVNHHVRPDSHVTLEAIKSIINEDRFDDFLDSVMDRVSAIESLGRTRELFLKEPFQIEAIRGKNGGFRVVGLGPVEDDDDADGGDDKKDGGDEKGGSRAIAVDLGSGGWRI